MSLREAVACLKENDNFLITAHINLEGDALGSELALYRLLKAMGKNAAILNQDSAPNIYKFLPDINDIRRFKKDLKDIKFNCFVALDCSDLKRCGAVSKLAKTNSPILNIDHHLSNEMFGSVNWVEPDSSSTVEMIYKLYKKMHIPLNKEIALLLYVGILTDTGSFQHPNTTSLTHKITAELLKYNLDTHSIYRNIYESIHFKDMKLLSRILPSIRLEANGKIAWFQIGCKIFKDEDISFDLSGALLRFARSIKGVEVAVLFRENPKAKDESKVNLRSHGKIDVKNIASFFGGGGHKNASGCTIKGRPATVRRRVLKKIKEVLKR